MLQAQIQKNQLKAFEHFVESWKKQEKDTIEVDGNSYSYRTKRGQKREYLGFRSLHECMHSGYYVMGMKVESVQGFWFLELPEIAVQEGGVYERNYCANNR